MTNRTFTFSVTSASSPTWLAGISDGEWGTIASVGTLDAVKPVLGSGAAPASTHSAVTNAWTGGAFDQTRNEYILAANGGHGDYSGNEVYALALNTATPAWARIKDPSPSFTRTDVAEAAAAVNPDGNPRSVHGWGRCTFGNGKVWYPAQDSYDSSAGNSTPYIFAFDRASLTWTGYGRLGGISPQQAFSFGTSVYDSKRNRIWTFGNANPTRVWYIDATTGVCSTVYQSILFGVIAEASWAVYAPDPVDRIIFGNTHAAVSPNTVGVLDPNSANPAAGFSVHSFTGAWTASGVDGEAIGNCAGPRVGAVYDSANKCVYVFDVGWTLGKSIKVLQLPASLGGTGASFAWRTHTPSGGVTPTASTGYRGTYTKFNMAENVVGKRVLVVVSSTTGPTYVMPLPTGGL